MLSCRYSIPDNHGQFHNGRQTTWQRMAQPSNNSARPNSQLGFEAELFKAADKLRGNMEPSDYQHVALGLIFLKYTSDAFEARHAELLAEDPQAAEERDEYLADNICWVPNDARWSMLSAAARRPEIGQLIDDAMCTIAEVPTAMNESFIAMKCDSTLPNVFAFFWCRENMDLILGNANGSTFQEISKSNFRPIPVIVPPKPILNTFRERVEPLYRHIVDYERESKALAQLRDTLLPKLISGELRVKDAELFIERAN